MWDYFAGVTRPDGFGPLNNDGDLEPNAWYLKAAAARNSNPRWLHIATAGAQGTQPPAPPSRYFPWAGQAVMRSGWGPESLWARFDMGPHGTNHQHYDHLAIELFAGGRPVLIDAGRYTYLPGRERDYFRGPSGHNVVCVSNRGSVRPPNRTGAPVDGIALREAEYDFFLGQTRFRGNALTGRGGGDWRRAVFHLRGRYWIVVDHLDVRTPADVSTGWLFHPGCTVSAEGESLYTTDAGKGNFAVVPAAGTAWRVEINRGRREPRMRGWYSEAYNRMEACCQAEYHMSIKGSVVFAWILFPIPAHTTPGPERLPNMSVSREGPCVRMDVTLPDGQGEDLAVIDLDAGPEITLDTNIGLKGPCALLHRGPGGERLFGQPLDAGPGEQDP
jgi:hypothetical protein